LEPTLNFEAAGTSETTGSAAFPRNASPRNGSASESCAPVEPAEILTAEEIAPEPHSRPVAALVEKIRTHTATVGIVGQGYVGLPLALLFSEEEFSVLGFDVDSDKIEALNRGESYIRHIGPERVAEARERTSRAGSAGFEATVDFDRDRELPPPSYPGNHVSISPSLRMS